MPMFGVTLRVEYRDVRETCVRVEAADAEAAGAEAVRMEEAGAELDWEGVDIIQAPPAPQL